MTLSLKVDRVTISLWLCKKWVFSEKTVHQRTGDLALEQGQILKWTPCERFNVEMPFFLFQIPSTVPFSIRSESFVSHVIIPSD